MNIAQITPCSWENATYPSMPPQNTAGALNFKGTVRPNFADNECGNNIKREIPEFFIIRDAIYIEPHRPLSARRKASKGPYPRPRTISVIQFKSKARRKRNNGCVSSKKAVLLWINLHRDDQGHKNWPKRRAFDSPFGWLLTFIFVNEQVPWMCVDHHHIAFCAIIWCKN